MISMSNSQVKSLLFSGLLISGLVSTQLIGFSPSYADSSSRATTGKITGKTVLGGALSLFIWPGIGQAINNDAGKKVGTHAIIGLFPPFRLWSGYDALVNRQGGYWNGKI
ncbi:MAG: hypothetical protein K2X66_06565 [Cyanobacteria bacterium]|nr:hypothetical protein [Cyanobacteriota bacterium]